MKSYWIAATIVFSIAWPSSSKAYVGQARAEEPPVQQAPASGSSASVAETTRVQAPSESPKPATAPGTTTGAATPAATQPKTSYMLVELSKTLKAKKLKPGDKIKAEVSQDVVSHGKIIIPVETELIGHVTEVSVRDNGNPESRLGFVFDRILLKHYHEINFQAVVQAVSAPVLRKSMVDRPSQMLPPSMVVGDLRQSSPVPSGRTGSSANRGATQASTSTAMASSSSIGFQAPLTVKQSPSTHVASGTSAAALQPGAGGSSLSVGTPQGVTGLKGLSLSSGPTAVTPGPVIVSNTADVKLESGTQILLRVVGVESQKEAAK